MLHYAGERADFSVDAGRSVSPGSTGGFSEADQIRAALAYALDEHSAAGFELSWREVRTGGSSTVRQLGAWASRQLSPHWGARASYRYVQRDLDGARDGSAHVASLSLSYNNTFL